MVRTFCVGAALAVSLGLFCASFARAGTYTWADQNDDVSWETGDAEWVGTGGTASTWPGTNSNPSVAYFTGLNQTYSPDDGNYVYIYSSPLYVTGIVVTADQYTFAESGTPLTLTSPFSISVSSTAIADFYTPISATTTTYTMTKTGPGLLEFYTANSYTGATIAAGGILRLIDPNALPGGNALAGGTSNLTFSGGIVDLSTGTNFYRGLGTGASQVQWTGAGGFSASGGTDEIVNLGGASATLTWASGNFVPAGSALMLGSSLDDSMVDFQNPIALGTAVRSIVIGHNPGVGAFFSTFDTQLSGALTGSAGGGLSISGSGFLNIAASNSYPGTTTVSGVVVRLSTSAALPGGTLNGSTNGNLSIGGSSIIELAASNFTLPLGTGNGQVQITGSAGFSAVGGNRIVNLGGGSAGLTWGSTTFLPTGNLLFGTINDDSMVDFQNPINLSSGTRSIVVTHGNALIDAQLSGSLSGAAGINFSGGGYINLAASNSYTGGTNVNAVVLRLSNSAALPGGTLTGNTSGNLTITNGGEIELAASNFTRSMGTAAGQVQFTGSGGFSAAGSNRVVNLGGGSAGITWGTTAGFVPSGQPLVLGSNSDSAMVDFQNPINLGGAARTIQVNEGQGSVDAQLSGAISGAGAASALIVNGPGILNLATTNTYAGTTTVSGGAVLRLSTTASLPGGVGATGGSANLILSSGEIELAANNFTRTLGTGASQVSFGTLAGFSAAGGNYTVNLSGTNAPATLTWGSGGFFTGGGTLAFGSVADSATVDFLNPINLSTAIQTIQVTHGSAVVDAQLSAVVGGGAGGGLYITGGGVLELLANNTYTGSTTIAGGVLRLSNSTSLPGGTATGSSGSNLAFAGGVVELNSTNFTRALGTGNGQVLWVSGSSGGFSAPRGRLGS